MFSDKKEQKQIDAAIASVIHREDLEMYLSMCVCVYYWSYLVLGCMKTIIFWTNTLKTGGDGNLKLHKGIEYSWQRRLWHEVDDVLLR